MHKFIVESDQFNPPIRAEIRLYKTVHVMRRAISSQFTSKDFAQDALAMFIGIISQDQQSVGILFFAQDSLCLEVIAHESTHAALEYASKHSLGDPYRTTEGSQYGPANESICDVCGWMTTAIFRKLCDVLPDGIDL